MYGTIARMKIDPARMAEFREFGRQGGMDRIPGLVKTYLYQMDADPGELFLVALFEDRESYRANAQSPEQNERYQQMRSFMLEDPEWHDGEIFTVE